jgi:hypothetical protein
MGFEVGPVKVTIEGKGGASVKREAKKVKDGLKGIGDEADKSAKKTAKGNKKAEKSFKDLKKEAKATKGFFGRMSKEADAYNKKLGDSNKKMKPFKDLLGNITTAAGPYAMAIGLVAAAMAAMLAITIKLVLHTTEFLDNLSKTSTRIGLSVEMISEWGYAAEKAGIDQNTFTMGLQRFQRRLADFKRTGGGEAAKAFKTMGIDADIASGKLKTTEDVLFAVSDKMKGVSDEGQKVLLAFQMFDSEGVKMNQMLADGSVALKKVIEDGKALGSTIKDEDVVASVEFKNAMADLKTALLALEREALKKLIPEFTKLVNWMKELTVAARENWGAVKILAQNMLNAVPGLGPMINAVGHLINLFRTLKSLMASTGDYIDSSVAGLGGGSHKANADASANAAISLIKRQSSLAKSKNTGGAALPPGGGGNKEDQFATDLQSAQEEIANMKIAAMVEEERIVAEFSKRYSEIMKGPYTGSQRDQLLQALGEYTTLKYEKLNQAEDEKQRQLQTKILADQKKAMEERIAAEQELETFMTEFNMSKLEGHQLELEEEKMHYQAQLDSFREYANQANLDKQSVLDWEAQITDAHRGRMKVINDGIAADRKGAKMKELEAATSLAKNMASLIGLSAKEQAKAQIPLEIAKAYQAFAAAASAFAPNPTVDVAGGLAAAAAAVKHLDAVKKLSAAAGGGGGGGGSSSGGGGGRKKDVPLEDDKNSLEEEKVKQTGTYIMNIPRDSYGNLYDFMRGAVDPLNEVLGDGSKIVVAKS